MHARWRKAWMAWKWPKSGPDRAHRSAGPRYNGGMSDTATRLAQQLLIALPALDDPNFSRTVTLICQHDANGAMGIVINRASEYSIGELFAQIDIEGGTPELLARPVLAGGPVHAERGFVLHDGERVWDSSIRLPGGLSLTTSRDVLAAMARGEGPDNALVALGCAGWGGGQLEQEIADNSWMTAPPDEEIVFRQPLEQRWQAAAGLVGVNLATMTHYAGHA